MAKKAKATTKITVEIPTNQARRIKGLAVATGRTVAQLIDEAITLRTAGFRVCLPGGKTTDEPEDIQNQAERNPSILEIIPRSA